MNTLDSHSDLEALRRIINRDYSVECTQLNLHRDWIGYVYLVEGKLNRYVLKLYRSFDMDKALHSIGVIQYLSENSYPVTTIVPTKDGKEYITFHTPQGQSIAILYDFIYGTEPDRQTEIEKIGRQIGQLHKLMKIYPHPIISRGKEYYIDRYIAMFREMGYSPKRTDELKEYGEELWKRMERLPQGFCHGDLHTGNMLQAEPGRYVLFDFDVASNAHSVIDVATLCDGSDYFHFDESAYDRTIEMFDRLYQGYGRECTLTDSEVNGIFDFIAIRHYEIQATIVQCQGLQCISTDFLDEQYEWLLNWRNLCEKKKH